MKEILLGITGNKETGKDTIANHLVELYNFEKYNLADPMKKALQILFKFTDDQLWGESKEIIDNHWNVTPRKVMQIFATDFIQFDIYKYLPEIEKKIPRRLFWVKLFEKWYNKKIYYDDILLQMNPSHFNEKTFRTVVADIRFIHEANYIKNMKGTIIKIKRNNKNIECPDKHISETELDQIKEDYLILNNSSIQNLYEKVDKILNIIKEKVRK